VTRSKSRQERLDEYAYEALGCRAGTQADESWAEWSSFYLQKFLDTV